VHIILPSSDTCSLSSHNSLFLWLVQLFTIADNLCSSPLPFNTGIGCFIRMAYIPHLTKQNNYRGMSFIKWIYYTEFIRWTESIILILDLQYHEGVRATWLAEKAGNIYRHPYNLGAFENLVSVTFFFYLHCACTPEILCQSIIVWKGSYLPLPIRSLGYTCKQKDWCVIQSMKDPLYLSF
jgi:hypothetical protein